MNASNTWHVVEFMNYNTEEGVPYVDCIPARWIIRNKKKDNLQAVYPAPPHDDKAIRLLHKTIKSNEDPDYSWMYWNINIRTSTGNT